MSVRFAHLGLVTATDDQLIELAAFFTDVLALPVSGEPGQGYAEVDAGGATIALHRGLMVEELVRPIGGVLLQLTCPDVRAEVESVRERGGRIALEPVDTDWGTTTAYVQGPHGLLTELSSPAVT